MGVGGTPKSSNKGELPEINVPKHSSTKPEPVSEFPPIEGLPDIVQSAKQEVIPSTEEQKESVEVSKEVIGDRIEPEEKNEVDPLDFVKIDDKLKAEESSDNSPREAEQKKEPEEFIEDYDLNFPDSKESHNEMDIKEEDISKEARKSTSKEKDIVSKEKMLNNKEAIIERMKQQNTKLKKEFSLLKAKLEECIEKAKKGYRSMSEKPPLTEDEISNCFSN